jgi:hypothetical protein
VTAGGLPEDIQRAGQALLALDEAGRSDLSRTLGQLLTVIADEAARSSRFANALQRALTSAPTSAEPVVRRSGRRAPGPFDPFAVYAEAGEDGLRTRLGKLDLEQLRDIVAEHGMDHDRLAMKWKDPVRVIDRIVERVAARSAKGSAFRTSTR